MEGGQDEHPHSGVEIATPLSSTVSAPQNKGRGGLWGPRRGLVPSSGLVLVCMELSSTKITIRNQTSTCHPSCPPPPSNPIHLQLPLDPILLTRWFPPIVPLLSFQISTGSRLSPQMQPSSGVQPPETTPILGKMSPRGPRH